MKSVSKHIELLDYVRGMAIIAVLLFHTLGHVYGYDELPWHGWLRNFSVPASFLCFLPFTSGGKAGVAIFFVISGFCIHLSFHQHAQRWGIFFIRRFFRIYPAYLGALVFSVLLILSYSQLDFKSWQLWKNLLVHLFLVHNLSPQTLIDFNGPFWSLAVEAQLYLLYPLLILFVAKLGWRKTLFILAVCESLIRSADGTVQTLNATDTVAGQISWLLSYSPLGFWFSWAIGAFLADSFLKNQPLPFLKISPWVWLGLATVSYFVKPLLAFQFLWFALLTASVISKFLTGNAPKLNVPLLFLQILKKFGLWSYSIYLLHQPLLNALTLAVVWAIPAEDRPAFLMFFLIVSTWSVILLMGFLWYKLFEVPAIVAGKRVIQKMELQQGAALQPKAAGENSIRKPAAFLLTVVTLLFAVATWFITAQLTPRDPKENNNRAWSLATSADTTQRNGALAVKLAEDACERTQYRETTMVGTLAAAFAEAGRFDEAISTAQRACALASQSGDSKLLQRNEELLNLYLNHQPYHQGRQ